MLQTDQNPLQSDAQLPWNSDSKLTSSLQQRQLREATRAMPVLVLFHFIAAISIYFIAINKVSDVVLLSWQVSVLLSGAAFLGIFWNWKSNLSKTVLRILPAQQILIASMFLALVWSAPPLVFTRLIPDDSSFIILGIVLAMMSMGIVTLLRLPTNAIAYTSFLSVVISSFLYSSLSAHRVLGTFICLAAGAVLVGMILVLHREFQRTTEIENAHQKQSQTIKLLLNDFERETSDWLWETNHDDELTYHSPSLTRFLNAPQNALLNHNIFTLLSPVCEIPTLTKFTDLVSQHQDIVNFILKTKQNNESQFWQISAHPTFDDHGNFQGYDGVSRDITIQHESEIEVRAAKESAERASLAKSQFLAVISHELRTPINAIVGFSEVLNDHDNENISAPNRKAYLDTILESAKQLQGLINDILDATRVERGTMQLTDQDIDVAELIEISTKICRDQATKSNITIIARVQEDINLTGDLTRLKQVLVNLLTNAIKFSPAKSVINIDMKRGPDHQLIIAIRDAGIGVSAADTERVFEPFVQLDEGSTRRFGGVGLGLSIARRIARLHGGDVTLQGTLGGGTEARLIIPAARLRWPNLNSKPSAKAEAAA